MTAITHVRHMLTAAEFQGLAEVPPAAEWFANLDNANTRRSYQNDLQEFMRFVGISAPVELRLVTRAHVLAWRKDLERRELSGSTIRRKLAALSSLFEYLSEANTVTHNPVKGVRRPKVESYEGQTPAISDAQARQLLKVPADTPKGLRNRTLLSLLRHHGLRHEELAQLTLGDIHERRGVMHLRVRGKGNKLRHVPLHPGSQELLADYLQGETRKALPPLPAREEPAGRPRPGDDDRRDLQAGTRLCQEAGPGDRRAFAAGDRGDQRARARGGHFKGPGVARTRARPLPPVIYA